MIALLFGLIILLVYFIFKNENRLVDKLGLVGFLCLAWGMSRYAGTSPKPLWDPN